MRYVKPTKTLSEHIIKDKEYKIEFETEFEYVFVDEKGDIIRGAKISPLIEIIDRPVMVKAWDNNYERNEEQELVHDLGESFEYRYISKDCDGDISGWKNIEYIEDKPKEEEKESNQIDSLKEEISTLKHDFQLMNMDLKEILRQLNKKLQ